MPDAVLTDITDEEFQAFRSLVYKSTGLYLKDGKRTLLRSRLMKRLRHHGYANFARYYQHLQRDDPSGSELQEMINAVTTHKTSFFREPHHFEYFRDELLLPAQAAGTSRTLRVWSAGCSSGEEPYTIAITIADSLQRLASWDVKILASDIDTDVIDKARRGIYPSEAVSELSPALVKRHFLRGKDNYAGFVRVKPELSRLVTFMRVNLLEESWGFRGQFDAIFCRNVMIYFERDLQHKLLKHFARHVKPGGLFFAGHSENLFWASDLLDPVGRTVYRVRQAGVR